MSAVKVKNCGCKGIRTCLLCEKLNGNFFTPQKERQVKYEYTYCPDCNLCWPDHSDSASKADFPLYLGKLTLVLDFLSEDEEAAAISAIDKIQWMPSQSGRKKQDFGPKVNFKKKKVKIGEFKGFPKFTQNILRKFENVSELSDFKPVELCHLEYTPERGSCIDPHVDDFWIWGERLVTVNLNSSTVLTLVPVSKDACECYEEFNNSSYNSRYNNRPSSSCGHKFQNISLLKYTLKSSSTTCNSDSCKKGITVDSNTDFSKLKDNFHDPESLTISNFQLSCNYMAGGINSRSYESNCNSEAIESQLNNDLQKMNINSCHHLNHNKTSPETSHTSQTPTDLELTKCDKDDEREPNMCSAFRSDVSEPIVAVKVLLPPRSLLVLSGCARYNWSHEIKRNDVPSRRLAMTFRELTAEFLDGGKESEIGKELLLTANNFYDFN